MKSESTIRPAQVERYSTLVRINYDLVEEKRKGMNEESMTFYLYQMIELNPESLTYDTLVSAMITEKYSIDAQIAILANKDDGNAVHQAEYEKFENFRKECKKIAKEVINN